MAKKKKRSLTERIAALINRVGRNQSRPSGTLRANLSSASAFPKFPMQTIIAANDKNALGVCVLSVWIIFACVAATIARNKGNSVAGAFLISILLSPLIGIIVALVQKPSEAAIEKERLQTGASKKCPFCAEVIKKEARLCRYCGRDINQQSEMSGVTEEQIEELWRKSGIGTDSQTRSSSQRETQFYILQGSDITGPFDKQRLLELRKSGIGDDDLVRREGVEGWTRLGAITDLS